MKSHRTTDKGEVVPPVDAIGLLLPAEYQLLVQYLRQLVDQDPFERFSNVEMESLVAQIGKYGVYWWRFYDHSLATHVAVLMRLIGIDQEVKDAEVAGGARRAIDVLFEKAADENPAIDTEVDPERLSLVVNGVIGLLYSMDSIRVFGRSIDELLERARAGDWVALRDALSIDRMVAATAVGAATIAVAQLADEKAVLSGLFKRMRPHEKRRAYDDLRFMVRVLEEAKGLDDGITANVIALLKDDLKLDPANGRDAEKLLRELVRLFRKKSTK